MATTQATAIRTEICRPDRHAASETDRLQSRAQGAGVATARPAGAGAPAPGASPGTMAPATRQAPAIWSQPSTSGRPGAGQPSRTDRLAARTANGLQGSPRATIVTGRNQ